MDDILEFLFELLLEVSVAVIKSSKIPKYIRYPLIGFLALCFIAVFGLIFFVGILLLKENLFFGIFLILVGFFLLIVSVIELRKAYKAYKKAKNHPASHS